MQQQIVSKISNEGQIMNELSIFEIQQKFEQGTLTAHQLVSHYLERIESIDRSGPMLNAIIELNPDALAIAQLLDEEREANGPRGPMHGIPVLVKDNIDTADAMTTTAGSLALAGSRPNQDAFIVQQLRKAGAIILGKTNLSEWANFRSTRSSSGWSSRGGQTRNPYALDRNPCGSSSGSGVAVAANLCAVAIGTETDGSILCPAQTNGVVGIKPTLGLVSRSGIIPIAHSQDTAGPMARTVADAAILLGALTGVDERDAETAVNKGHADYTSYLDKNGLQGARIGVARDYFGRDPNVDAIMEQSIAAMRALGAEVVDPVEIKTKDQVRESEFTVLLYEFKADLNQYLAALGDDAPISSLEQLIAFNNAHPDKTMPYFGQELLQMAQEKGALTDDDYVEALQKNHQLSRGEGIDATMSEHQLDAIIAPSGQPAWPIDWVNGDSHKGIGASGITAVSGYPSITVPAGYVHGLPVGMSIFAQAFSEPALIKFAYAFEQATKVRQSPQFLPTLFS
ncbi:MAG: amidase [Chloroflexota bacterium]